MFTFMVIVFIVGYMFIALEHPVKIDKAASALLIGVLTWVLFILDAQGILEMGFSRSWEHFQTSTVLTDYLATTPNATLVDKMTYFITHHEILHHLSEISAILFFLLGAMTIVEVIDQHQGFKLITDRITTTSKVKLLWILSILTFFMSAALDNLTTTIVLVALIRKLIDDKHTRWFFSSMVVLAANAGGAWSPIGDVTTIMLWIGGQITAGHIIAHVVFPSLICMLVPLIIVSFKLKGNITRPQLDENANKDFTTSFERRLILIMGLACLLFVPVFKTITHLPPYMGILFGLSIMWLATEVLHRNKRGEDKRKLSVIGILRKVDVPTVFFFMGILSAVAALQSAGHLNLLSGFLDKIGNVYVIDLAIGVLSSIVDNVPLVAGAMGTYEVLTPEIANAAANPEYASMFIKDGTFWEFLAYTAGTGGSVLIIGSAAGVAAMGMEKIDFIWYMKRISILALIGYLAGAAAYWSQSLIF
ncbi:MAG: sodium:proton antiporter NhaD [Hyphomicrobiales bacterium]